MIIDKTNMIIYANAIEHADLRMRAFGFIDMKTNDGSPFVLTSLSMLFGFRIVILSPPPIPRVQFVARIISYF